MQEQLPDGRERPACPPSISYAGNCWAEKCSCIFDGQEPECLEGHGWPREAGMSAID